MNQIKFILISLVLGIVTGSIGMYFIMAPNKSDLEKIKTTQISGEKIDHKKWNFRGSSVSFNTVSQGKGEIKTDIPKILIPEAAAWMNKTTAIGILLSQKYVPVLKMGVTGIGLSLHGRWESIDFGGGPITEFTTESKPKFHSVGAFIQARYWFSTSAK